MKRGPSNFRQRDVEAAIKAARRAGETGAVRVEIARDGTIRIITSRENAEPMAVGNPWDEDA